MKGIELIAYIKENNLEDFEMLVEVSFRAEFTEYKPVVSIENGVMRSY